MFRFADDAVSIKIVDTFLIFFGAFFTILALHIVESCGVALLKIGLACFKRFVRERVVKQTGLRYDMLNVKLFGKELFTGDVCLRIESLVAVVF